METVTIHNYREPRLMMGVAGAVAAGTVGMLAWYWLIRLTNYEIGYAAWGIGVLVGWSARKLAGNGNMSLGLAAAACALVAIIGGQFLATNHGVDVYLDEQASTYYTARLSFAQEAVNAQTDEEFRAVVAKHLSDEDQTVNPSTVTEEQITQFREEQMPELREFVNGNPTQEEYEKWVVGVIKAGIPKDLILKSSVSLFTILWLFLGVGSAWKLARAEEVPVEPTTPTPTPAA